MKKLAALMAVAAALGVGASWCRCRLQLNPHHRCQRFNRQRPHRRRHRHRRALAVAPEPERLKWHDPGRDARRHGQRIADYPAGGPVPSIDSAALPFLPWDVEVRSPSGRVLTTMHVDIGEVVTTTPTGAVAGRTIPFGRVDLSCGRLTIWAGDFPPSGPAPPPSPGRPGDCAP